MPTDPGNAGADPQPAPAAGWECPDCHTRQAGRYCESCGYDSVLPPAPASSTPTDAGRAGGTGGSGSASAPGSASTSGGASTPGGSGTPVSGGTPGSAGTPRGSGTSGTSGAAGGGPAAGADGAVAAGPAVAGAGAAGSVATDAGAGAAADVRVVVVATADRAFYDAQCAAASSTAGSIPFPAYYPERRFRVRGPRALIGRRSLSRGIEPAVDLSGPYEDAAVGHEHAMLLTQPDGGWAVVDLRSLNGTYLNGYPEPIQPSVPVQLADGDRIHLGAWTTLTVHPER